MLDAHVFFNKRMQGAVVFGHCGVHWKFLHVVNWLPRECVGSSFFCGDVPISESD